MALLRIVACALLLALLMAGSAPAQSHRVSLDQSVAGHPEIAYLDLVKLLMPDLTAEGGGYAGTLPAGIRHVLPDYTDSAAPIRSPFGDVDALPLRSNGRERLAILIDFNSAGGEGISVLALFGFEGEVRLLDAAHVSLDRDTSFQEPGVLKIGADESALVTVSSHHNSSQGYSALALILVKDDRLRLIDDIWLISDRTCTFDRNEKPSFKALPGSGRFGDIEATVTETVSPSDEDCGDELKPKPSERIFRVVYQWDEAAETYRASSDAIKRLEAENEERL